MVDRLLLGDALADEQPADRHDGGDDRGGDPDEGSGTPGGRHAPPRVLRAGLGEHHPAGWYGRDIPRRTSLALHAILHVLPAAAAVAAVVV